MPETRYVISIKSLEVEDPMVAGEWRYAGIDNGPYGSGYPCWCYSIYTCKIFNSIKDAEEWFNQAKECLFDTYYKNTKFDKSTLGIREIAFRKVKSLNV